MVKLLTENERVELEKFIKIEPEINLFILGDVEIYGISTDFMDMWAGINDEGSIRSVLLRYYDYFITYNNGYESDNEEYKRIIKNHKEKSVLSGKTTVLEDFHNIYKEKEIKKTYFSKLTSKDKLKDFDNEVKLAEPKDAKRLYDFIIGIDEFSTVSSNSIEKIERVIESKEGRVYYIENEEGQIISQAQTAAENSTSAMVVGVATREEYRNKGLVSKCISKLCNDLLDEEKTLCLFYENPIAGRLYKKIGFEDIGNWTMIIEK